MLFGVENATPTVDIDASIGSFPFAVYKTNDYFGLAFMAGELD